MHNARAIWTYFQMHDDVDELVHWTQYAYVCGNIAASILERERKKNWFVTLQWPAVWQAGNASIGSCNIHYSQCSGSHELHVIRVARCVYVNDLRPSALFQFNASSWVKVTENRWNEYHPFSVTAIATYSVGRYEYQHRLSTFRRCEGHPPHIVWVDVLASHSSMCGVCVAWSLWTQIQNKTISWNSIFVRFTGGFSGELTTLARGVCCRLSAAGALFPHSAIINSVIQFNRMSIRYPRKPNRSQKCIFSEFMFDGIIHNTQLRTWSTRMRWHNQRFTNHQLEFNQMIWTWNTS